MRRRVPVLLCALLLIAAGYGAVPGSAQSGVEETRLEAQLQADGDARWSIVATMPLEDEQDVQHFQTFASAFEKGERDFRLGTDSFRRAAGEASTASGREMSVHSERREATVVTESTGDQDDRYGRLTVSFTWESFARMDENQTLYVDDAFNTTNGTWLKTLVGGETLVVRAPPGYSAPSTAPVGARQGDLTWTGPETFEPGYFEMVYSPTGAQGFDWSVSTVLLGSAVVLSLFALLLGVYLLWRRRETDQEPAPEDDPDVTVADTDDADVADTAKTTVNAPENGLADDPATEEDPELLSDEERVEYLLERNGGRMKQANIVKETGWSNAKVSQLLSSMAEDERVDKLRIGRENLISLPDENVSDLATGRDEE